MANIFLNLDLKEYYTHLVHYVKQFSYGRKGTVLWYVPLKLPLDTAKLPLDEFKKRVEQEEKFYDEQLKKLCFQFFGSYTINS